MESWYDFDMLIAQLETLRNKVSGCTQMASTYLELSNGRALRELAEASAKEAKKAAEMAEQSQQDSAAMKALTVIAAIFLPTTVVLNFFSASFVETTDSGMHLVHEWWLFAAIGLPLTLVVLMLWYLWMQYQLRRVRRKRAEAQAADNKNATDNV